MAKLSSIAGNIVVILSKSTDEAEMAKMQSFESEDPTEVATQVLGAE